MFSLRPLICTPADRIARLNSEVNNALRNPKVVEGATKGLVLTVDPACGNPFVNAYGPYDYRTNQGPQLKIVEDYHFTPEVEGLIRGVSGALAGEIDYTLRAFPNHHRALAAMMNLSAKMKSNTLKGANWTVECYFTRALAFRNDDQIARMLGCTVMRPCSKRGGSRSIGR